MAVSVVYLNFKLVRSAGSGHNALVIMMNAGVEPEKRRKWYN